MTYRGHVEGGVIVLEGGKRPPEGMIVRIEPLRKPRAKKKPESVSGMLLSLAGRVKGLPRDMARNHDHYLHGHPKR